MNLRKSGTVKNRIIIFLYFCLQIILRAPSVEMMYEWPWRTTPYALTYDLGINSRFLVGSVVNLFTDRLDAKTLYIIIMTANILLAAAVAHMLCKVIDRADDENKNTVIYLVLLFLATPTNISFLFSQHNYGVFDIYHIIITVIMVLLIKNKYLRWFIPALSLICVAIHQIYVCTYMAIICVALLYETVENKFRRSDVVLTLTTYAVIVVSFVYLQFFVQPLPFDNEYEMLSYLKEKTDIPLTDMMLKWEYFCSVGYNFRYFFLDSNWKHHVASGVITLITLLPIYISFFLFLRKAYLQTKKGISRLPLLAIMLSPLLAVPAFVIAKDYDRWFGSVIICQLSLIFYLYVRRQEGVCKTMIQLKRLTERHKLFAVMFIIYFALSMFVPVHSLGDVGRMFKDMFTEGVRR